MKFGRTAALFMTLITLVGCRTAAGVSTLPVEPPLPLTLVPVPSATPIRLVYGPDVDNVGELYLPDNDADSVPVVVMVHGGGWLSKPDMTHFRPLAEAVAERGIAVWNIEYRRERNDYKDTLTDIDNAIDILATTAQEAAGGRLDPPPHAPSESESAVPRRMASERRLGLAGRGPGPFTEVTMREAASPPAKDVAWVSIVSLC